VRASKKKKKHASRGLVNAGTSAKNSFGGRAIVDAGIHSVGGSRVQAEFCGFGGFNATSPKVLEEDGGF
jgi:ferritin-like metal-binding protein YciE